MKKFRNSLHLIFVSFVLLSVSTSAIAALDVSGNITSSATWGIDYPSPDGVYIVTGNVQVFGAGVTLTIEAGVEVRFNQNRRLLIGNGGTYGRLLVEGTSESPVMFTSNQTTPSKGYWYNLFFYQNSDDSVLNYAVIEYGGGYNGAEVYLDSADVTFNHCSVGASSTRGIRAAGVSAPHLNYTDVYDCESHGMHFQNSSDPTISNCSSLNNGEHGVLFETTGSPVVDSGDFSDNGEYGIYCNNANVLISVINSSFTGNGEAPLSLGASRVGYSSGNVFSDNLYSYIEVFGDTISDDAFWENQGISYRITGETYVEGEDGDDLLTVLEIEPGTNLQFSSGRGLHIGHASNSSLPGALIADASSGKAPITFTSDGSGYWDGLYFKRYCDDTVTVIDGCFLMMGGERPRNNLLQ